MIILCRDTTTKAVATGNTLTSSAATARRAGVTITYSASVKYDKVQQANAGAKALATNPATLVTNIGSANTALSKTVAVPSASTITASSEVTTGGTSGAGAFPYSTALLAGVLAIVALRQ